MTPSPSAPPRITASERAFRLLVALFPRDFRDRFGSEMAETFRDQLRDAQRGGPMAVPALWARTIVPFTVAAIREHAATVHQSPITSGSMLDSVRTDLTFAFRTLRKAPLFTIVAVACIAVGSGAVATIFSGMNAMVLRPLPAAENAAQLFRVERKEPGRKDGVSASYPYFEYIRDNARTTDGVVAWSKAQLSLRPDGAEMGTSIYGNWVSGNFFSVLGVRPALGRFFVPDEDRTDGTHPVIVVSEDFWRTKLGADSGAVGNVIWVNGRRFTLVGVAPREFGGTDAPIQTDAWVPVRMRHALFPGVAPLASAEHIVMRMAARVKEGVDPLTAHQELSQLTAAFSESGAEPAWMAKYADARFSQLTGLPPDATGPLSQFLAMLLAAATLVLLIASINVASMLSARAIARRREMAVRAALGAARGRLVRQLLTEILLLFALGAAGGIAIAYAATSALERLQVPAELQFDFELSPDARVLAFAVAVSLVIGLVVGLLPALRAARSDVASRLRDGAAAATGRRTWGANTLVVGQMAFSLVLLVGAGLFVRALQRGKALDAGFDPRGVATAQLNADAWGYDEAKARGFMGELRARLEGMPGVTSVSLTHVLPLALGGSGGTVHLPDGKEEGTQVRQNMVDAGFLSTLGIPLVAGREIQETDRPGAPPVAVVNETFVKQHMPAGALGRTFRYGDATVTIVGVARDAKYTSLNEVTPPMVYFPLAQHWRAPLFAVVRTNGDERALAPGIAEAVRSLDAALPRPVVRPMREAMSLGLFPQRVAALVTGVLGGAGLLLATVGLYGIIAYSVSRRTKEIGIRMALGARAADVLGMVLRDGMSLAAAGVVIGVLLAAAASRLITSFLYGVSPLDWITFGGMSLALGAVALFATWLPARRAAGANPVSVLRMD